MLEFIEQLTGGVEIWAEANIYDSDEDLPVRLVACDRDGVRKAELLFTPERARDSAYSLVPLLEFRLSRDESFRVAEGLQRAARKVLSARG